DFNESDVDCGGRCGGCAEGLSCAGDLDCLALVCARGRCNAACRDGKLDGDESDVDCGGSACSPCLDGHTRRPDLACNSTRCAAKTCQPGACDDFVKNGEETGVDCGGSRCPTCPVGAACNLGRDCTSGVCQGGRCLDAHCGNGAQDAGETDVDCGGPCFGCAGGLACAADQDCLA